MTEAKLILPHNIASQLITALQRAGEQEIGGILMGENISEGAFRITEITIQSRGGARSRFERLVMHFLAPLQRFFDNTGHNYTRFNYVGEWHSHPLFPLVPSHVDSNTMWELVHDPKVGANFAILLIVRLNSFDDLEGAVTVYLPDYRCFKGQLVQEGDKL